MRRPAITRPHASPRRIALALGALAIGALVAAAGLRSTRDGQRSAAGGTGSAGLAPRAQADRAAGEPRPLDGARIRGRTGLHLVVAERRPFVLDVDGDSTAYVRGLPRVERGVLSVVSVGGSGAAIIVPMAGGPRIFGLSARMRR